MLQRMQTLWLFFAAACAFLSIRLSFFGGNLEVPGQPATYQYLNAAFNIWILIITIGIICISLIDIFLYKKRKLQSRLAILAILLSLLNIYLYYKQTLKFTNGNYSLTSILTFLIPVFLFLAVRGISRDEKLVKSLNRLR
jgi:predicted ferric reductase